MNECDEGSSISWGGTNGDRTRYSSTNNASITHGQSMIHSYSTCINHIVFAITLCRIVLYRIGLLR